MRLLDFWHKENFTRTEWNLSNQVQFGSQNLLVGKNAIGKSKTIQSIAQAASQMAGKIDFDEFKDTETSLCLEANGYHYSYQFCCKGKNIVSESLKVNDEPIIIRNETETSIKGENINPPHDSLIIQTRRDVDNYPEIEKIVAWAENVRSFSFNELDDDYGDISPRSLGNRYSREGNRDLYSMLSSLSEEGRQRIVNSSNEIDFNLEKISIWNEIKIVLVKERGIGDLLFQDLSKGLRRTLYVLTCLAYFSEQDEPGLLLIDDLCEGLDYDRSIKLGKMVYDYCRDHSIQLIASSNDSFLMDIVDIDDWNILTREGTSVKVMNKQSNPDLFERFKMTGLSNFDFFSSDFIARHTN